MARSEKWTSDGPASGNARGVKRVSELCRAARGWAAGLAFVVMAVNAVPAFAGSEGRTSGWAETYAGAFAGAGRPDNRIVDVDGFADWGNPGSRTGYAGAGAVGGLLVGKRYGIGGVRFRVEADAMFGDLSASTDWLKPGCTDEAKIDIAELSCLDRPRHGSAEAFLPAVELTGPPPRSARENGKFLRISAVQHCPSPGSARFAGSLAEAPAFL